MICWWNLLTLTYFLCPAHLSWGNGLVSSDNGPSLGEKRGSFTAADLYPGRSRRSFVCMKDLFFLRRYGGFACFD